MIGGIEPAVIAIPGGLIAVFVILWALDRASGSDARNQAKAVESNSPIHDDFLRGVALSVLTGVTGVLFEVRGSLLVAAVCFAGGFVGGGIQYLERSSKGRVPAVRWLVVRGLILPIALVVTWRAGWITMTPLVALPTTAWVAGVAYAHLYPESSGVPPAT